MARSEHSPKHRLLQSAEGTGRKQLAMAGVTNDICLVFSSINAVNDGYEMQAPGRLGNFI
jgi:isochorismate hydrolase